ncbi:MAG: hypothetical protein ACTSYB_14830 [Candidatus Helarchaeota archaeon]
MDWLIASLWIGIVVALFILALRFLFQARKLEQGSVGRNTNFALSIMFLIIGSTKLFDILLVNLGSAPEPIPFLADMVGIPEGDIYLGLLVMSLYLIGFSVLLFVLEKYTINTKYILTITPLLVIIGAWILTLMGIKIDLFLVNLYQEPTALLLLFFYVPRSFIPLAYLYLAIKTPGTYRKKAFTLFLGYGCITTFFIRQPQFEFLAPYMIIGGLIFILWGHKE